MLSNFRCYEGSLGEFRRIFLAELARISQKRLKKFVNEAMMKMERRKRKKKDWSDWCCTRKKKVF